MDIIIGFVDKDGIFGLTSSTCDPMIGDLHTNLFDNPSIRKTVQNGFYHEIKFPEYRYAWVVPAPFRLHN